MRRERNHKAWKYNNKSTCRIQNTKKCPLFLFLWRRRIRDAESLFSIASVYQHKKTQRSMKIASAAFLASAFVFTIQRVIPGIPFTFYCIIYCWVRDDLKKLHNWWGQTESPHKGFSILNEAVVYFTLKIDSVNEPSRNKKCFVLRESVHKHRWNTVQICRGFSASFARRLRSSNRHKVMKAEMFREDVYWKAKVPKSAGELTWFCLMLRVFAVHSHHSLNSPLYMCVCAWQTLWGIYILHVYITREEDITLMHPLMTNT